MIRACFRCLKGWAIGLLAGSLLLPPATAQQLPLAPDSLQAVLDAAPAGTRRIDALLRVGQAFLVQEQLDSAGVLAYARAAEGLARRLTDSVRTGQALDLRGAFYESTGDLRQAAPLLRVAERWLRNAPPGIKATNLDHLGSLATNLHRPEQALAYHKRAYVLARQARDTGARLRMLLQVGNVYQNAERHDSAVWYFYQAVRVCQQRGDSRSEADALDQIGESYYAQNRLVEAMRYVRQAYQLRQRMGTTVDLGRSLSGLGALALATDSLEAALAYFRHQLRLMREADLYGHIENAYNGLAVAHERLHHLDSAAYYYQQAVAATEPLDNPAQLGLLLNNLARYYLKQRRWAEATRYATRTLTLDHGRPHPDNTPDAWEVLRQVAEQQGDYQRAYELLKQQQTFVRAQQEQANTRLTEELRVGYETEQAEQQVRLLTQARELERLRRQQQVGGLAALAVVLLALVGGVVWWYRRRQAQREQALRMRLAADLHDDVGSLLSQIALQSDLLQEGLTPPDQQPAQWAEVADSSRMAVRQLNDVVWSLDAHNDTLPGLLARLHDYAHEVLRPTGREVRFVAEGLPALPLPPAARRHLYLIYKEALHNILKHAPPQALVTVALRYADGQLQLDILNDGPPPTPGTGPGRISGHGLRNIRERAAAVGGRATAEPQAPGGFAVRVSVPV